MNQSTITVIVNNNTYNLSTSNVEALRRIPAADRQQLIALLELVKQQERVAQSPISQTTTEATSTACNVGNSLNPQTMHMGSERLGSGDVDALVAQLMAEEKAKSKPGVTKGTIYKWVVGVVVVVVLLVVAL